MADKSKNTGTGGIDIDGKVYTMDVGVSDSNGGAQGNWSPGDIAVDDTKKDITTPTRETFAKYLSRATLAKVGSSTHPNAYPVGTGAATSVQKISTTDAKGNPIAPGQSVNESKFNSGFNSSMAAPPPLAMKKGIADGTAPDGNKLLPTAAEPANSGGEYVKNAKELKEPIKGYTTGQLDKNLYDPDTTKVVPSSGNVNEQPQNVRDLRYVDPASNVVVDGGTSKNILGPDSTGNYTLTAAERAAQAKAVTVGNRYPVDSPAATPTKLTDPQGNPLPVTAAQNNISNSKFFSKEIIKVNNQNFVTSKIQSSYSDALDESKPDFAIKRGKESGGTGKDGNELLPNIAIKDEITGVVNLDSAAQIYTTKVLDQNLHSPLGQSPVTDSNKVVIGDGGNTQPDNVRDVNVMLVGDPLGESTVAMNPTANNSLTLRERAEYAAAQTLNPDGPSGPNAYPVDPPAVIFNPNKLVDSNGNPIGPTTVENSEYFTKTNPTAPSLQTRTDAFAASVQETNDPLQIKRGKSTQPGVDGNQLLPAITVVNEFNKTVLNPQAENYIRNVTDPNLREVGAAKPINPGFANTSPINLRQIPPIGDTSPADLGTSENVMNPANGSYSLQMSQLMNIPNQQTQEVANKFVVDAVNTAFAAGKTYDSPSTTPSVTAQQNNPNNSDYYTKDVNLQSSYTDAAGDLDIIRGRVVNPSPDAVDGNELLLAATGPGAPGGPYVKSAGELKEPIQKYTQNVFGKNLYKPGKGVNSSTNDDHSTVANAGTANEDFYGPKNLHIPRAGDDVGTFDNIRTDPGKNTLGKKDAQAKPLFMMAGQDGTVPGNIANDYYPSELPTITSLTQDGYPRSPTEDQTSQTGEGTFISGKTLSNPESWGPSSAYVDSSLGSKIKKGKSPKEVPNGHTILQDIKKNAPGAILDDNPIKGYVSDVLKNNRFSRSNPFYRTILDDYETKSHDRDIGDPAFTGDTKSEGKALIEASKFASPDQMQYGHYLRSQDKNGKEVFVRPYDYKRLTKIGTILQLRATGELDSLAQQPADPRFDLTPLAALAPGVGQLGAGVPLSSKLLDIKDIILNLPPDDADTSSAYEGQLVDFNTKFEGVINNVFDKFSGFTALGMIATCTALVTAIVLVFEGFGALIGLKGASKIDGNAPKKQNNVGRAGMGTFYGVGTGSSPDDIINAFLPAGGDSSILLRFLGIMPTQGAFFDAVNAGLKAFFGLGENFDPLTTFQSPGHFVVQARAIVRSALEIALAFKDLIDLFASGNVFAGIEQIFEILYIIKKSRFVASLNIFAQLGDTFSNMPDYWDQTVEGLDASKKYSKIDSQFDERPDASHRKNRLNYANKTNLKLSWASNRTPDQLLISPRSSILSLDASLGAGKLLTDDPYQRTKINSVDEEGVGSRFPTEVRESIESEFDSEYLPFYFHDLRTNEILGFHAFLTSLSDDYTASYDSTDGFGRIDAIKIYKKTDRKIGLSFIIAATDEKDFDSMWLKINKLTTLIYPQYTEGRFITTEDNSTFARPFSQLIGASPMIRLRIGNLITSNYSKFNLAGIFGLNTQNAVLKGTASKDIVKAYKDGVEKIKKDKDKLLYVKGYVFNISFNRPLNQILVGQETVNAAVGTGLVPPIQKEYDFSSCDLIFQAEIIEATFDDAGNASGGIKIKLVRTPPAQEGTGKLKGQEKQLLQYLFGDFFSGKLPDVDKAEFFVMPDQLLSLDETSQKKYNEEVFGAAATYLAEVNAFMNDTGPIGTAGVNSIAKSFRSAGGKGLAGFIDNISFDWFNSTTWDIDINRKAPKMCKVTLSFSPIHDISPGLDSNGSNRAPIYQLGPYRARK